MSSLHEFVVVVWFTIRETRAIRRAKKGITGWAIDIIRNTPRVLLILFEENLNKVAFKRQVEGLVQGEMVKRRPYTYSSGGGLPYFNKDVTVTELKTD